MTVTSTNPDTMQKMDNAAGDAENDLINVDEDAIQAVAKWWKKWYPKAGHKRLGRILVAELKKD